jgi:hypothetical protein
LDALRKFIVTHPDVPKPPAMSPEADATAFVGPFIGPGTPITPIQGEGGPRYFDYVSGVNANVVPRTEYNGVIPTFNQLWNAYLLMPIMRVCVTFRAQQILSLGWKMKAKEGSGFRVGRNGDSDGARELVKLFERPDPQNGYNFEQWFRSILEEVYVTDAVSIWPVRSKTKRVMGFMQIDGQTIKPLIDYERGGIPAPPHPAFLQYIKGTAFRAFTSEQLVYRPFRPRVWCVYGQSRVENVFTSASLYQMFENWTSDYFTQGNIPEAVYLMDPTQETNWTPQKQREWQELFDKLYGDNVARRRVHVAPPFVRDVKVLKEFSFSRELPDWIVRLLCIEFGVPAYLFTSQTNRATAHEMNEALYEAPLRHDLMSGKRLMDELIGIAGAPDMEFEWAKEYDYRKESVEGLVMLTSPPGVNAKPIMTIQEARLNLGLAEGEGEQDDEQPETDPGDADPSGDDSSPPEAGSEGDDTEAPNQRPSATDDGEKPAPRDEPAEQKVARLALVKESKVPHVGKKRGRRFTGRGAVDRARMATGLANVVLKRLRQQEAQIMQEAVERARARQKKVKGA